MSYSRFAAMVATSTVVMFGLMYLNTFALDQGGRYVHFCLDCEQTVYRSEAEGS